MLSLIRVIAVVPNHGQIMPSNPLQSCDDGNIQSTTIAITSGSRRAKCESDGLATPEGCCFDGHRCDGKQP